MPQRVPTTRHGRVPRLQPARQLLQPFVHLPRLPRCTSPPQAPCQRRPRSDHGDHAHAVWNRPAVGQSRLRGGGRWRHRAEPGLLLLGHAGGIRSRRGIHPRPVRQHHHLHPDRKSSGEQRFLKLRQRQRQPRRACWRPHPTGRSHIHLRTDRRRIVGIRPPSTDRARALAERLRRGADRHRRRDGPPP